MFVNLSRFIEKKEVIAVALSGGSDSMALFNFLLENQNKYCYKVIALNVEHGIRGEESLKDTEFVKNYCKEKGIKVLSYSVNSVKYSKENNLSLEEGARKLRYDCFFDAIKSGKCNKVATAHHLDDNFESILLNMFRGTGIKGLTGIEENYQNKIIRPFVSVSKNEIMEYIETNKIPFVTDSTNLSDDYTRNYLRLNIIPKIKEIFPSAEKSVFRLSNIIRQDNDFIESEVAKKIKYLKDSVEVFIPIDNSLLARASILAMKYLGVEKDWLSSHITQIENIALLQTGASVDLPNGVVAVKEYDKICFYKKKTTENLNKPFSVSDFIFNNKQYQIRKIEKPIDLKSGFFADLDKIPNGAVIRTKQDGDLFTKYGGGTKKLNDFLTDKKIPLKNRKAIPVIAIDNKILFIFEIAISDLIKVDENSKNIVQFV